MDVLGWLEKVWCAVTNIAWWIADLLVMLLNTLIVALAAVAFAAMELFPDLPGVSEGSVPADVLRWANWLFPIGGLLGIFAGYLALYIAARLLMAAVRLLDRLGAMDSGR